MLNKLFPIEHVKKIDDIDYDRLIKSGYDVFLFDYDFTLAPWGELKINERTRKVFEMLHELGVKVFVVTNAKKERVEHLKETFPWIKVYWSMRKPSIKRLQKVLKEEGVDPKRCVIIGDLFLTDVLAGNRAGMYTIMVNPYLYEALKFYKKFFGVLSMVLYRILFFTFGWFFRTGALISPNEWRISIKDIDYETLIEHGFKLFIYDYDNTLAPWRCETIPNEHIEILEKVAKRANVLIASNGKERNVNVSYDVIWRSFKPIGNKIKRKIKKMGIDYKDCVVIGDQLFTDVLFGNLIGAYTIKVEPMNSKEAPITKLNRALEKMFSKILVEKPRITKGENGV